MSRRFYITRASLVGTMLPTPHRQLASLRTFFNCFTLLLFSDQLKFKVATVTHSLAQSHRNYDATQAFDRMNSWTTGVRTTELAHI